MADSDDTFSLLYLSESTIPFRKRDPRKLLSKSRENNAKLGVTGMLLFKSGNFLQVLEGQRETVLTLYKKIAHYSVPGRFAPAELSRLVHGFSGFGLR
jgi:Sensors of blue-light using FAD